jgi:aspartyl protease family protein
MAIGFISLKVMTRTSIRAIIIAVASLGASVSASAADTNVNVVGLFAGKALLEINKTRARMVSAGDSINGVKLISADSSTAVVEIDGKRETLKLGQSIAAAGPASGDKPKAILSADSRGHFITTGIVNGASTRLLVDTGASHVSISTAEAKRLGISYLNGVRGVSSTANGTVQTYRVKLDSVQVGGITLNQVDCAVIEGDTLPVALLGMSFLNRLEMRREGTTLTLLKNY